MAPPRQLLALVAVLVAAAACSAAAQPATAEAAPDSSPDVGGIKVSFRPSVAIVVGIFTMIFSLTFLLLIYAKFCHTSSSSPLPTTDPPGINGAAAAAVAPTQAGVPKPVIEALPFFRFAALRGARQGMECAVCLARFDDGDHLRLLPRCRHAFHLACVDRWLESNASCPLCRTRVDAEDASLGLKYPSSARIVFGGGDGMSSSGRLDDGDAGSGRDLLDIFVERVPSTRFLGGAASKSKQDAPARAPSSPELDRHKHRIIVSDVVFKSRWSELNSAALIALDTEMLRSMSSGRFSLPSDSPEHNEAAKLSTSAAAAEEEAAGGVVETTRGETERKRLLVDGRRGGGRCSTSAAVDAVAPSAARMISSGVRSVSEIVSLPRLRGAARERLSEEENRRWLPIARRTARWFAGRARGEREDDDEGDAGVHVVAAHV
ncbi:hypothetical protein HU200_019411 [Digitaria exilis]|uniref:RING-type E3 ubiquitin transferase n=1 Tax=Digitaria exilis TaxID=1010633 RepID=A0A835KCY1_9POAL|nr:hypothetical protein HU200_019411 [Digitaria exilis]CAB3460515.1 unnamed protein product [Digitaria exilis]